MTATLNRPDPVAEPASGVLQEVSGYLHPNYAHALSEFGEPHLLSRSGGWLLKRPIANTGYHDAIGCYPILCCRDWTRLHADLDDLNDELVSLATVIDPFANVAEGQLLQSFDIVRRYKEHWCVDLQLIGETIGNKHHRYYARKALQELTVEVHTQPLPYVTEWAEMYANLVRRHQISGIQAFSKQAFAAQMRVPGMLMFRAIKDGVAVAAQLWYVQGDVVYNHLAAATELGYRANASYALYHQAISVFRDGLAPGLRFVQLGAGAGVAAKEDGLTQFKKGWANCSRPAYFCGRIFNRRAYEALSGANAARGDYFPAYREGEMN